MIPIVSGEGGVDQRQTADAPPEHQQDQYPMRKLSELRRYAERQAYRPDGGCCFIQSDGKLKIFCRADDAPAGEKQRQIQQQNGRSAFYNAAVDAAVKKLRRFLLSEYGIHVCRKHGKRRDFHSAGG